jgi:hypothetical protein
MRDQLDQLDLLARAMAGTRRAVASPVIRTWHAVGSDRRLVMVSAFGLPAFGGFGGLDGQGL